MDELRPQNTTIYERGRCSRLPLTGRGVVSRVPGISSAILVAVGHGPGEGYSLARRAMMRTAFGTGVSDTRMRYPPPPAPESFQPSTRSWYCWIR
jgi:hypothetical protein